MENTIIITGINYGCFDILQNAHVCLLNACQKLMADAVSLLHMDPLSSARLDAINQVHYSMQAMTRGDVSFQIANGDRLLVHVGGEHCKTFLAYAFPGQSIDMWSAGQ